MYPSLRRQVARPLASSLHGPDPSAVKSASATPNDDEAWRLSASTTSLVTKTPAPPRLSLTPEFIVVLVYCEMIQDGEVYDCCISFADKGSCPTPKNLYALHVD